jgi:membrane-associated phospholipid phosphatase
MELANPLDQAVADWFYNLAVGNLWLVDVGVVLAYVLHPWVFRALVLAACVWAWRRGRHRAALVCAATMAVGGLLGIGLKLAIRRDRPFWGEPVAQEVGFAMPSGHALNATLGCLLLLVIFWPQLGMLGRTRLAASVAGLVILLACLDRLLLGVHFLTDVVAGVLIGVALALVADRLTPRLRGGMADGMFRG